MTLLPIVLRELSVASRRRSTYTTRVGAAIIVIMATVWLLILGGLTATEVTRVGLVLGNALFFSLAAGVFVSTVSGDERKAMFATFGLILTVTVGPYALANYYAWYDQTSAAQLERHFLFPS